MAHGITEIDAGVVGFTVEFGKTWHGLPQYRQLDGPVLLEDIEKIMGYEVVKVPLILNTGADEVTGKLPANVDPATSLYALVRSDTGTKVYDGAVGGEFTPFQNLEFLKKLEDALLSVYPTVAIESAGTLWSGHTVFINILLNRFRFNKDKSETISRLMYSNVFGGGSISACAHHTRIVCNNTLRMATAQGAANKTLKKFRHTSGVPERVERYVVELAELLEVEKAQRAVIDTLTTLQMGVADVRNFLGNLFPIPAETKPGRTMSIRTNRQNAVREIFETAEDLQGDVAGTRFAMLQAVTNWNQHTIPEDSTEVDAAFAWYEVASGGKRDDLNQQALSLLAVPEIATCANPSAN